MSYFKKFLCCVLVLVLVLFGGIVCNKSVQAEQKKPLKCWNLQSKRHGGQGKYKGIGECSTINLYSNYYFWQVGKIRITVRNKSITRSLRIKVYQCGEEKDRCVGTVKISPSGKTTWTLLTNLSDKYYLKFYRPANFSWNVKQG